MPPLPPAVFLDRDNTLIVNDGDLGDPDAVVLMQGAAMAVASLCGLGFRTFVVTNQGGVARGRYREQDVDAVHQRLAELLEQQATGARVDGFYYCPFHPEGTSHHYRREHPDRKPAPGMLLRAAAEHGIDLRSSWMIGDAMRDVAAGEAAGCRTILLHPDAFQLTPAAAAARDPVRLVLPGDLDADPPPAAGAAAEVDRPQARPDYVAASLVEAVRIVASQRHARIEAERVHKPHKPSKPRNAQPRPEPPARTTEPVDPAGAPDPPSPATTPQHPAGPPTPSGEQPEPHPGLPQVPEQAAPAAAAAPAAGGSSWSPPSPEPLAPTRPGPAAEQTLRQILQELRGQRGRDGSDGRVLMVAAVLQAAAVICLIGGLYLSGGTTPEQGVLTLLRWAFPGVLLQVGVLAALHLHQDRHR